MNRTHTDPITPRARAAWRLAAALALAGLLAGCGFQLRGGQVLSAGADRLYVSGPALLSREIGVFLEGSDTDVVSSQEEADVLLTLSNERYDRRVLSVDPDTGKEREFEISYSVDLNARRADGSVLVPTQTLSLVRDFVFDRDALIGKSREQSVLREEMRTDAAQQILFRLRSASQP